VYDVIASSEFTLAPHLSTINECFSKDTIEDIFASLEAASSRDALARHSLVQLRTKSPLALKVALRQLRLAKTQKIGDALRTEYALAINNLV
jgi:hypothetical protein